MSYTYLQVRNELDNRAVYEVQPQHVGSADLIKTHGILVATRWAGVWEIAGTVRIRDKRYIELLENTPLVEG